MSDLTPPAMWPIGCRYNTVYFVQSRDRDGLYDPLCGERICLPEETNKLLEQIKRNESVTIYDIVQRKWRGVING